MSVIPSAGATFVDRRIPMDAAERNTSISAVGDDVGGRGLASDEARSSHGTVQNNCPYCDNTSDVGRCARCGAREILSPNPKSLATLALTCGLFAAAVVHFIGVDLLPSLTIGLLGGVLIFGLTPVQFIWSPGAARVSQHSRKA